MIKKSIYFVVIFLLTSLCYTYSFTEKDLLLLINPLKLKQKFINNWIISDIYSEKQQDILIEIQNIQTNRKLLLWLIKRADNVPYIKQTNNFNIQCVFLSNPYNLNKEEKKVINNVIDKIKVNDIGKIHLAEKTNPQVIDLDRNKYLEKELGIKRIQEPTKIKNRFWKLIFKIPSENTLLPFIFILIFCIIIYKTITKVLKKK